VSPTELETACRDFFRLKEKNATQKTEIQRIELETLAETEKLKTLQIMAEIRGEAIPSTETTKLKEFQTEIQNTEQEIRNLEQKIFTALKDFMLPVPLKEPEVENDKSSILLEGEPCTNTVQFLAFILDSKIPIEVDNIALYPDKVVVKEVQKSSQAAISLRNFRDNIRRLARAALKEKDSDIEQVASYLYGSAYKEIWEAVKGKREVTVQELFTALNVVDSKEQKKIRNFFTNLELVLKSKNPFSARPDRVHELNFFGVLVWKRYQELYLKNEEEKIDKNEERARAPTEDEQEVRQKPDEGKINEKPTLNDYLSPNKIKDTIYGEKVE
jgi:hypothetical protein